MCTLVKVFQRPKKGIWKNSSSGTDAHIPLCRDAYLQKFFHFSPTFERLRWTLFLDHSCRKSPVFLIMSVSGEAWPSHLKLHDTGQVIL